MRGRNHAGGQMTVTDSADVWKGFIRRAAQREASRARFEMRARLEPVARAPKEPVFVMGCPRSGTSLLFALLRRHPAFASLGKEGHVLWSTYQHPARKGWSSDAAGASDVTETERHYLYAAIDHIAGSRRFLDKTPKNALKVAYLDALFPDCMFVFIRRDGRATVSSLIEGWQARHGVSYRVPERLCLQEYDGRFWSYALPPGWRMLRGTTIGDVAAHQYVTTNELALDALSKIPDERVSHVSFEELVRDPGRKAADIVRGLGLPDDEHFRAAASRIASHPFGSLSPPKEGKWRTRSDVIDRVMPRIAATLDRMGYQREAP
jgi:hypothetical protein